MGPGRDPRAALGARSWPGVLRSRGDAGRRRPLRFGSRRARLAAGTVRRRRNRSQPRGGCCCRSAAALDGPILARSDSAGVSHALADACRETAVRFSFGYPVDTRVRETILALPEAAWRPALTADAPRGRVGGRAHRPRLARRWPPGSRLIVRRERAPAPRRPALRVALGEASEVVIEEAERFLAEVERDLRRARAAWAWLA